MGSGRGAVGWGAKNLGGAARNGRCDERRRLRSVLLAPVRPSSEEGEGRNGTGSFGASAWLRAALNAEVGRDCRRMDALAGDHSGGMGVRLTVTSRRSTVYSFE